MNRKFRGTGSARRALSVIAGTVAVVLTATMAPADASVSISEFGTPFFSSNPGGVTVGPDGNIWFTEVPAGSDALGSLTPDRTSPPTFGNDDFVNSGSSLGNVTTGSDGNLWFTTLGSPNSIEDQIGRMTPSGAVTLWTLDNPNNSVPPDIVAGPDGNGNLWFTENSSGMLGQITTSGTITTFNPGMCGSFPVMPLNIAAGPDGNLWFTVSDCADIGRITTSGTVTMFPITFRATDITAGPDGNLWFSGSTGIGKINPTTGTFTAVEFRYPGTSIAPSPCANDLWFTSGTGSVGKVTTSGAVSLYSLPTANSNPDDITAAPNGTVFLTEPTAAGGQLARVVDTASLIPCVILLANHVFALSALTFSKQGGIMHWMVQAPGTHGVADASGMKLFGFSPASGLPTPVPIGSFVSFKFSWAGTYPYDDPFDAANAGGQVSVPIKVARVVGAPGANVTWASGAAPAGFGFDVQVKTPGSAGWITWQSGVSSLSAQFGPNDPLWAGPGSYSFQARLRQLTSNAASGYSTPKSITIS